MKVLILEDGRATAEVNRVSCATDGTMCNHAATTQRLQDSHTVADGLARYAGVVEHQICCLTALLMIHKVDCT